MSDRSLVAAMRAGWSTALAWIAEMLGWKTAYRALSYLQSALWVVPIAAVLLALVFTRLLQQARSLRHVGPDRARGRRRANPVSDHHHADTHVCRLHFGSLLVAVQIASGQLTPRIIATTLLRDRVIKYTVGLNMFTMLFAVTALNRTVDTVPQLVALVAAVLGVACVASFLFLIDYAARLLRPVRLVALVCDQGLDVIRSVYPEEEATTDGEQRVKARMARPAVAVVTTGGDRRSFSRSRSSHWCRRHDASTASSNSCRRSVTSLRPTSRCSTFTAARPGSTRRPCAGRWCSARAHHGAGSDVRVPDPRGHRDQGAVAGHQRPHDGGARDRPDPPAAAGGGPPAPARRGHTRCGGHVRLVLRTPNWEDFVHIACSEIRACGAGSIQVARRMRAMLENLVRTLPRSAIPALKEQLDLLDRTLPEFYKFAEDLALARVADSQGLGGASSGSRAAGSSRRPLMQPLIPEWFISAFAVATVFVVMFHLGLGILPREFLRIWRQPALTLKALFSVLVAVPVIALVVSRTLGCRAPPRSASCSWRSLPGRRSR